MHDADIISVAYTDVRLGAKGRREQMPSNRAVYSHELAVSGKCSGE